MDDAFRLLQHDDGHYSLTFDDFYGSPKVAEAFEEAGYESGGYGWHGVTEVLVRMKAPHLASQVSFDPEAGMFAAYGPSREALVQLAALMREAMSDVELLGEALKQVDPELMD